MPTDNKPDNAWVTVTEEDVDLLVSAKTWRPTSTFDMLLRLNAFQREICDMQASLQTTREELEQILETSQPSIDSRREAKQRSACLKDQLHDIDVRRQAYEREQKKLEALRARNKERRKLLGEARSRCTTGKMYLDENRSKLDANKATLATTQRELGLYRAEISFHLEEIYTIERVPNESNTIRILGVPLPNSDLFGGDNDQNISTALGYAAHLCMLIARYLSIPLRYLIKPMGSRATILDFVSQIQGLREFPLYTKGMDRFRFEYAVFLLNKNIEQLLNFQGISIVDLRKTVPNLLLLIENMKDGTTSRRTIMG